MAFVNESQSICELETMNSREEEQTNAPIEEGEAHAEINKR